MGHYVRKHILIGALESGLMALVGLFLVDRLFPMAVRLTAQRGDRHRDPADCR